MITVVKEFTFDAAHFLPDYNGPCSQMHGHTYKLQVGVTGPLLDGMVIDFTILKNLVKRVVLLKVDHALLNEVKAHGFPRGNPTAENIVMWIANELVGGLVGTDIEMELEFIRLWETPTSYAEWKEEGK